MVKFVVKFFYLSTNGINFSSDLVFQIELLVSCTELAKVDTFSKTDPMCALFIKRFGQWKEYGRSEAVQDMINPKVKLQIE